MAIAVVMKFNGVSLEQYDQVVDRMGFDRGGAGGPGGIFHWVTQTEDGLQITDVWESKDAFERFGGVIGPILQDLGVTVQPEVYPAHTLVTA